MAQDYRTKKEINQTQALFTNGLFIGVLLGILLSIGVTLFNTSSFRIFENKRRLTASNE